MANRLVLSGFVELKRELDALPTSLQRESTPILLRYARGAQDAVVNAYPRITGELRDGVKILERQARGIASLLTLVTSAPYAHIYEFGSVHQRPRPTFLPIAETARRRSVVDVADMVETHGLTVRGARD